MSSAEIPFDPEKYADGNVAYGGRFEIPRPGPLKKPPEGFGDKPLEDEGRVFDIKKIREQAEAARLAELAVAEKDLDLISGTGGDTDIDIKKPRVGGTVNLRKN